jgi:hypothetical protein
VSVCGHKSVSVALCVCGHQSASLIVLVCGHQSVSVAVLCECVWSSGSISGGTL